MSANCSHTARPQDPVDLVEHRPLVGAQVDHPVGDHDVRPAVLHRERLGQPFAELDVVEPERAAVWRDLSSISAVMSTPTTRPDRADLVGGDERVEPGAGSDIDDTLTGLQLTQRERVGDTGERLDGPIRQPVDDVRVVAEAGGQRAAGVEVEAVCGRDGDLAVLLAHLRTQHLGVRQTALTSPASSARSCPQRPGSLLSRSVR